MASKHVDSIKKHTYRVQISYFIKSFIYKMTSENSGAHYLNGSYYDAVILKNALMKIA